MKMALSEIVLCDSLLKLYLDFKNGNRLNLNEKKKLEQLLSHYKPHQTNKDQYDRINAQMDTAMEAQLQAAGFNGLNERDLAKKTKLKLILTDAKSTYAYPYVNIDGCDSLKLTFSGTFKNKPRSKCVEHLKAMCSSANHVIVYDKYLCDSKNFSSGIISNFFDLLKSAENVELTILLPLAPDLYAKQHADIGAWWKSNSKNYPKVHCAFQQVDATNDYHDRYMKINSPTGDVEVLLSSGFDHLFGSAQDFTYVVTPI